MFTVHISSCIYRMYTHTHAFPRLFLLIGCFMIVRPHMPMDLMVFLGPVGNSMS